MKLKYAHLVTNLYGVATRRVLYLSFIVQPRPVRSAFTGSEIVQALLQSWRSGFGRGIRLAFYGTLCATLLSACFDIKVPTYKRPDTPEKTAYSKPVVTASETIQPDWWKQFHDPYLDSLVTKAIASNFEYQGARRAHRRGGRADRRGARRARCRPWISAPAPSFEKTTGQTFSKQYNVATQVNWDIDIWGEVEKGVQAQKAEFHATRGGLARGLSGAGRRTYRGPISRSSSSTTRSSSSKKRSRTNRKILTIYEGSSRNGLVPQTQVLTQQAEINRLTNQLLELRRSRDLANNALCHVDRRAGRRLQVARQAICSSACNSGGACTGCPRNCSRGGPTWWRPSIACWKPTTSSARPSSRNCRPSA